MCMFTREFNGLERGVWEQWQGEGCVVPNDAKWKTDTPASEYNGSDKSNLLNDGFFWEHKGKGWFKKWRGADNSYHAGPGTAHLAWECWVGLGWAGAAACMLPPFTQCFALRGFICQKENQFTKYLQGYMATGLNTYIWNPWKQFASSRPPFQTSFSLHLLVQVHKFLGKNHLLHHWKMPQK